MDKLISFSSLLNKLGNTKLTETESEAFVSLWNDFFGNINKTINKPDDAFSVCCKK